MELMKQFSQKYMKENAPEVNVGDTVRVHIRVKEGSRERIQVFEGTVIAKKHGGIEESFTVRRISYGVGVEKVFPLHAPTIEKVETVRRVRCAAPSCTTSGTGWARPPRSRRTCKQALQRRKRSGDPAPFLHTRREEALPPSGGIAMNIQWYPGHMTKTRRQMEEDVKFVDMVAEVVDARIPISSRNPDIDAMVGDRPRMMIFNRADQADPEQTARWLARFRAMGFAVLETDAKTGRGVGQFSAVVKGALKDKIAAWRAKGQVGRRVRVMVVGVPNVGKSTLINKIAKKKSAKAGDRPGVTRGKQWVSVDSGLELLDTPGILWPKFEDETTGLHLAFTGAVKDEVMDSEALAAALMELLRDRYPQALSRYKLEPASELAGWELLEQAARKRGMLISGGEVDTERMSRVLLDEFRGGKLGNFTLERPEDLPEKE